MKTFAFLGRVGFGALAASVTRPVAVLTCTGGILEMRRPLSGERAFARVLATR